MYPRIRSAAACAAISILSIGLLSGCAHSAPTPEKTPTPVKVRAVERAPELTTARYSGVLEPASRVDLAFRVNGHVEALGEVSDHGKSRPLEVGDFVKKGSLLARVRSADYAQKLLTSNAQVEQARADARLADAELERARKLFDTKAITKADFDAKLAKAEWTKANVDGAIARSGEAGVALADTVLRAPLDGVVLSRDIEVGTLVSPGRPVLSIADVRTVKASFGVPQTLVEKLSLGRPVQVQIGSEGSSDAAARLIDARITRIAPAADAKGRVFSVEAELANPTGTLRPGSVIAVHVPNSGLNEASISVPLSAVVRAPNDARGFAVYVLDGLALRARAHLQRVKLGEVLGNSVTVTDGLQLGQRVVTVGSTLIQDGSDAVVIP